MPAALTDPVRAFLRSPNPSVMATTAQDGRPVTAATWYLLEPDDRILLNFDASRVRLRHLRRDPRFALDVLELADWYTRVALQCVGVELSDDTERTDVDALARHYTGAPYFSRTEDRVSLRAEIVHVMPWGALR